MPTLLEEAQKAHAGLEKVRMANQMRHQLAVIQHRTGEWAKHKQQHAQLQPKTGYLPMDESAVAQLAKANESVRALCTQAHQRLKESQNVEVLSNDDLWLRLLGAAEQANKVFADAIRAAWSMLIRELGDLESLTAISSRIPATPANEKALASYRELFGRYAALKSAEMPASAASAGQLRECVAQLREIHSSLTPAPASVQKFFKAVDAGGASLDLITEEVLAWLKSHDDWARFVVRLRAGNVWR
ncbi:hypothetical protein AWV79_24160 [Cupriavidus sp. UYMMa02A]|nr:hypothetical protein AWV79_24160 [Cupriavidus sp. UYMMa02A]